MFCFFFGRGRSAVAGRAGAATSSVSWRAFDSSSFKSAMAS
jgi:hypothetical protein